MSAGDKEDKRLQLERKLEQDTAELEALQASIPVFLIDKRLVKYERAFR
jgi:hypothetical protein